MKHYECVCGDALPTAYWDGYNDARKELVGGLLQSIYDACKENEHGQVVMDCGAIEALAKQYRVEVR